MSIIEKALDKAGVDEVHFASENSISNSNASGSSNRLKRINRRRAAGCTLNDVTQNVMCSENLQSSGYVSTDKESKSFSDDIQRLKLIVTKKAKSSTTEGLDNSHVLVTSSIPGEGKTHVSLNLALSIAQDQNLKVVLVDTDIMKQDMSKILGLADKKGFIDVVKSKTLAPKSLQGAIYKTDIEDLYFVPAGNYVANDENIISSEVMKYIFDEISLMGDNIIIVVDSAPVLVSVQTQASTATVGQVLYVVGAGTTPQSEFGQAIEMVGQDSIAVGLVINKLRKKSNQSYYGQYS